MFIARKALCLIIFFATCFVLCRAQHTSKKYTALWQHVNELAFKKGLTRQALQTVNKIYTVAKKEKQQPQVIKALIYQGYLQDALEEDAPEKYIYRLEKESKEMKGASLAVINSLLAEKYQQYFRRRSWQLYTRTETSNYTSKDITTWSVADFNRKISALYEASIQNEKLLQQAQVTGFDAVITKGNVRYLRPSLYDFLAHRALRYFMNDERDVLKPAFAFTITGAPYFAPAVAFTRMVIHSPDSASLQQKAVKVFQRLLAFHARDAAPDALIDADLLRLEFVRQYSVSEDKEARYAGALENITATYGNVPAAAQAWYLLAQWHAARAAQYNPHQDTAYRYEYRTARALCQSVARQKKASEGRSNCLNLLAETARKALSVETEKVNVPGAPFRSLVRYRNTGSMHLRIIVLPGNLKNQLQDRADTGFWKQVTALPGIRNWQQPLPATNDFQQHSVEIKIDALPVGEYLLLAGTDSLFSSPSNVMAVQNFHVSRISYAGNNNNEYFLLDRETGKPLAGAAVQLWREQYNSKTRRYEQVKTESAVSGNNGYYKLKRLEQYGNVRLEIKYANDRLFLDDNIYTAYRREAGEEKEWNARAFEKAKARTFFFTDRSIYRPGQILYFKGIAITRDAITRKTKVLESISSTVLLYNANGEPVDSVAVTTNAFGAYSGSFHLPENVLNGQFRIADGNLHGESYFSVEAYKRPTFYITIETAAGTYKVDDTISITGFAKAYAGNNINSAAVKYRVVRRSRFIYPWLYWRRGIPQGGSMEISNGAVTTGDDGKFTVRFKAIPDKSVSKKLDPVFDYQVTADITAPNGETRSGGSVVQVSYKAMQLQVTVPLGEVAPADSLRTITITTKNMSGVPEPALVHVSVYRLQTPGRLIRKRYWEAPDQFVYPSETFIQLFPFDEYDRETDLHTWSKGEKVFDATDSSNSGPGFSTGKTTFAEGWYVIEAVARDKFGDTVKDVQYVQLYDERKADPSFTYAWSMQRNKSTEPGEKETITIGSAAADLFVIQQVRNRRFPDDEGGVTNNTSGYSIITLNREKKQFAFPVTENDRGGFGVTHFFVKNNRLYVLSNEVMVPWTNKELQIGYETFRDKTLPGSEEKWTLKISGYRKEKVAAEMLVSMYDLSLDQFNMHQWNLPNIWPAALPGSSWTGYNNFNAVQSVERYQPADEITTVEKTYDQLLDPDRNRVGVKFTRPGMVMSQAATRKSRSVAGAPASSFGTEEAVMDVQLEELPAGKPAPPAGTDLAVPLRRNFNETAFFFPDLKTDAAGAISFSFTMPEALTTWKLQCLAHTRDGALGYTSREVITSKPLMVQPNVPRFLREGDRMELSTRIVNMTTHEMTGTVRLELLDALTGKPVDGWFQNMTANQYFTAEAGKSVTAGFSIQVPYQYNSAILYRFIASSAGVQGEAVSDGEEAALPVLTNSMLVTESMPMPLRGTTSKSFSFQKLLQSGASETLQQHALTVEFTTNPAWYAVQSLPYLNERKYDCSEQHFNAFYANALAAKIAQSAPRLQAVFNRWLPAASQTEAGADSTGMLANLQKNTELKSVLLQETPWVLEAKTQAQQQRNIAALFDMSRMSRELAASLERLQQFQLPNGGFAWFKGGPDDRYITQYIVTGIGHLKKLGALPLSAPQVNDITAKAISYLDSRIKEDYARLAATKLTGRNTGYLQVQYLYLRSFFPEYAIMGATITAAGYFRSQARQNWVEQNKYMQGMTALALYRSGDEQTAGKIIRSLQQTAIVNEETGMYWKENRSGYYWYQAPVETQSLLIEAFSDITKNKKVVDDMKTWLLKQKQTNSWPTTKATAEACYALLLQGSDWTSAVPSVEIKLGDKIIESGDESSAGNGYFKKTYAGPFIQPAMGSINVKVAAGSRGTTGAAPTWGAVYWQYFEKLDKITPSASPLKLEKKLFVENNTARGPVLEPVTEGSVLKTGDKVKVRIVLRTDRDMEYVHLKDMRAGCMEPVNVLSGYKWQGGLGYYETTLDAGTSFFINRLPKGTYVFEYPLFVTHTGNFSNGVTSAQCLYAPEFSTHSEGIRISVE